MHTGTALTALAAAAIGTASAQIRTAPFLPRTVSENPAINGWVLGQFHPGPNPDIADIWGPLTESATVLPSDYMFLTGDSSTTLALVWNRLPLFQGLYMVTPNEPLEIRPLSSGRKGLLEGLYTGGGPDKDIYHVENKDFTFTACARDPANRMLPNYYVSYLWSKTDVIAPNCSRFWVNSTMLSAVPYPDTP